MKKTIIGEIASEYCAKYPNMTNGALTRLLMKDHPKVFTGENHTDIAVRRARGRMGEYHRPHATTKRDPGTALDGWLPLPEPLYEGEDWCVVPLTFERALLFCDVHVPFHDVAACDIAMRDGQRRGVDCIIVNGDLCDFHAISPWETDPRLRDYARELDIAREFLRVVRARFPKARIIFKEGNHEERLWRYLWKRAPEFSNMPELSIGELLHLKEFGIELVADRRLLLAGEHLYIAHGHEWGEAINKVVNPARGLFMRAKCNAICGHLHRTSYHNETAIVKQISCWSVGGLLKQRPRYRPINDWNHGFAVIEMSGQSWRVENLRIINREVV